MGRIGLMGPALAAGAIESFGEAAFVEECLFEGSELAVEKEIRLIDQADQGVGRVEDDLRDLIGLQVVVAAMRGNDPRPMSPISPICPIPLSSPLLHHKSNSIAAAGADQAVSPSRASGASSRSRTVTKLPAE